MRSVCCVWGVCAVFEECVLCLRSVVDLWRARRWSSLCRWCRECLHTGSPLYWSDWSYSRYTACRRSSSHKPALNRESSRENTAALHSINKPLLRVRVFANVIWPPVFQAIRRKWRLTAFVSSVSGFPNFFLFFFPFFCAYKIILVWSIYILRFKNWNRIALKLCAIPCYFFLIVIVKCNYFIGRNV